jgi:hypothetical protein
MKQWITLLAATAIFSSCTKQDLQQEEENLQLEIEVTSAAMRSAQDGAFVSEWQQYHQWVKSDKGDMSSFAMTRKTPEVNSAVKDGGLVLSYAKAESQEPAYARFKNPTLIPFYFLPETVRPYPYHFYFSDAISEGKITVTYQMALTKEDMPHIGGGVYLSDMKFQFVVMTRQFLEAHAIDAQTIRDSYTYEQVMNLAGQ